jgi:hypothetical protein
MRFLLTAGTQSPQDRCAEVFYSLHTGYRVYTSFLLKKIARSNEQAWVETGREEKSFALCIAECPLVKDFSLPPAQNLTGSFEMTTF